MKRKWIRVLALGMTLSMMMGVMLTRPLAGSAAEMVKLDEPNSLMVTYPTGIVGMSDAELADLTTKTDIAVDVYKVAEAKENKGYDGYYYDAPTGFYAGLLDAAKAAADEEDKDKLEGEKINFSNYLIEETIAGSTVKKIDMNAVDAHFWEALAQAAAKMTLTKDALGASGTTPEYVGTISVGKQEKTPGNKPLEELQWWEKLDSGLYLLIPRDACFDRVTGVEKYTMTEDGSIVTVAYSTVHGYAFEPILVSLPTKEPYDYTPDDDVDDSVINTGNPGEWQYEMAIALKAQRLNGSLEIVKRVPNYEDSQPATFVFQVTATKPTGETAFDRVLALTFREAGEKTLLIEDIPAGSTVKVEEVYSGSYKKTPGGAIRFEREDGRMGVDADGNPVPLEADQTIAMDAELAKTNAALAEANAEAALATALTRINIGAARLVVVEFENNYDYNRRGGHGITNHFSYNSDIGEWELTQYPDNAAGAAGTDVPANPVIPSVSDGQ